VPFAFIMKIFRRLLLFAAAIYVLSAAVGFEGLTQAPPAGQKESAASREDAYRANNLGVALLEQYKYKEGADAFTRALQLDPKLQLARVNLSIALFNVPDLAGAQREAEKSIAANANLPQPHYILGLVAKSQNRVEDAIAAFQRVLKIDPLDTGANVNVGQLYVQQKKYPEAIAAFRTAIGVEPYNMTALYNLGLALTRNNERAEGQAVIQRFQQLRQSGAGTTIGQNYLEQGRYAEAIASTGAEADLVDKRTPEVVFTDATSGLLPLTKEETTPVATRTARDLISPAKPGEKRIGDWGKYSGGGVLLFDFDSDGDLDIFGVAVPERKLYRNDGGKFTDVTAQSGLLGEEAKGMPAGAVAGDFDNDGKPDLLITGTSPLTLYRNEGGGRFRNVTTAAQIPDYPYHSEAAAFVDVDHDGDLDIFVAGGSDLSKRLQAGNVVDASKPLHAAAPNLLLRNNGNNTFTDVTAAAKLDASAGQAVAVVPTDYDNRRDVDLLVISSHAPPALWKNLRDGTFRNVAAEVGLELKGGQFGCVAAGDVNKDGFTDFYFGRADSPGEFALSDGRGRFNVSPAPASSATSSHTAAQFLDYDNDGLLDLVTVSHWEKGGGGVRVLRNTGDGWVDASDKASRNLFADAPEARPLPVFLASGDLDIDGDVDLIVTSWLHRDTGGGLVLARNEGGNRHRSVRVTLAGKVSNRSGIGAKIEARAGSLQQKLETYSATPAPAPADIVFGLGERTQLDAVRVIWPAGIVQAETEIGAKAATATTPASNINLTVTELDRKPSSCPYLYTWNGERFEFITDFMGGGEMGYWEAPGHYNTPDPVEYVRIPGSKLKERDGLLEIRVTNELEEVLYVDRLQLIAVAHPASLEVYPNEGMTSPPRPFKLHTTRSARPPVSATDEHGHDVTALISKIDRQYPDDFPLERLRGYAGEHHLTLKLDEEKGRARRTLLLLTGWTDYAFSSDNVAASHAGLQMKPPALQVKDALGRWQTVIENIGIPVGRPQTVTVDLTGKFLSASREVRILTSMRIYWDQILVDNSSGRESLQMTRLDPIEASLRWRGYSREVTPDGREPFGYDYEQVSETSPWKVIPGRYTRVGDVRELLLKTDDLFVISRTGDEISLSFDASALPKLPAGWTRTFLLYSDGFSKEMDINSASPDQIAPLPFHGMKRYPYRAPERYPMTPARRAYIERYNTRLVTAPVPLLVNSK
jgi:tetratricopeptide (TPR) repeat protein